MATTYPLPLVKLRVTIAGADRTAEVASRTLEVHRVLGGQVDTARFSMHSPSSWRGVATTQPSVGQSVLIELQDAGGSFIAVFGGTVHRSAGIRIALAVVRWDIECVDYTNLLARTLVNRTYYQAEISTIVKDVVQRYAPTVITDGVQTTAITLPSIAFPYMTPKDVITQLANQVGYQWYVDALRVLHFYLPSATPQTSSQSITDTSNNFMDLNIEPQLDQVRNRVWVQGGNQLSAPYIEIWDANGKKTEWPLRYQNIIPATSADGTQMQFLSINGVYQGVGIEGQDDEALFANGGFMLNQPRGIVRTAQGTPTPGAGVQLRFQYFTTVPIGVVREDAVSMQTIATLEATDYLTMVSGDKPLHWFRLADAATTFTAGNSGTAGVTYSGGYTGTFDRPVAGPLVGGLGRAAQFFDSRIQCTSGTILPRSEFTVEAWVQTNPAGRRSANPYDSGIVSQWKNSQGGARLYVTSGGTYAFTTKQATGVALTVDSSTPPIGGEFDHVVATWKNGVGFGSETIYVNGVSQATGLGVPALPTVAVSGVEIGNYGYTDSDTITHTMRGKIAEATIYNYVLSGSQVAAHYNSGRFAGVREEVITDNTINSFGQARAEGDAILTRWSNVITKLSWHSYVSGWRLGDSVTVNVTTTKLGRPFSGTALIQELTIVSEGAQKFRYDIVCMATRFNLIDYQLALAAAAPHGITPLGVVLNVIEATKDQLVMIDSPVNTVTATPPFKVQPDWGAALNPPIKCEFWLADRNLF